MAAAAAVGMEKEKVIKVLGYYSQIDGDISIHRSILNDLEQYYDPVGAIRYDGLPNGKNHISRQTENLALNIPDYVREEVKYHQGKINELQKLKVEIIKEVSRLKLKQKRIVFDYYFYGLNWGKVAARTHYSDRQCKNIRNAALDILSQRFCRNRIIVSFDIPD